MITIKSLLFLILLLVTNLCYSQIDFTSSKLPIIIINTNGQKILDEPKIFATMGIIDNGIGKENRISDSFNGYNGKIGIEIRGHSSQMFPKKQYGIELWDESGNSINSSLLGMPSENDWVLNASYTDKTFLRNVITYKLGNDLGRYASRTKFCEVIINNEYMGLYILQEKIKRDKNRVNIKKLEAPDSTGDALTGGYILKIDRIDLGDKYFNSSFPSVYPKSPVIPSPISYIHVYPNSKNILPVQQDYIRNYITAFETSLSNDDYNNPLSGFYKYIDINSFVDYYLVSEFVKAVDAYRLSAYLYKNRETEGGKLNFGPLWDYDLAFGLPDYNNAWLSSGWQAHVPPYEGIWSTPFWTKKIFDDPVFYNLLAKRWHEIKDSVFNPTKLFNYIDQMSLSILDARVRNFIKWPILGVYVWPEKFVGQNYEEEILYLKGWIAQRYAWMDKTLPSNYSYVQWKQLPKQWLLWEKDRNSLIPLSKIYDQYQNVTSLQFISDNPNISFGILNDALIIRAEYIGDYTFRGVARNQSTIVAISPEFTINFGTHGTDVKQNQNIPKEYKLFQNFPNPFNPTTKIIFSIPEKSFVSIIIYDLFGKEIFELTNDEFIPGYHELNFDGNNLSSGVYFYRLTAGNFSQTKKLLKIK